MKKIKYLILLALCVFTIAISSCNKKPTKCEHISSEWIIDQQATCTTTGSKHTECTKCHEKLETDVVEALGHNIVHYEKKEATCKEAGNEAYDACSRCDYTTYEEILALNHNNEGGVCTKCGQKEPKKEYIIEGNYVYCGYYPQTLNDENNYICNDTNDKVYLLSKQDVINAEYGFMTGAFNKDTLKQKIPTDYAKAVGCGFEEDKDIYHWWLRTPSSAQVINVVTIRLDGAAYGQRGIYSGEVGVVPAITVTFD